MEQHLISLTRRKIVFGLGAATLAALTPGQSLAGFLSTRAKRKLALFNIHTKDEVEVTYWKNGKYDEESLLKINELMRDHRQEEVIAMDVNVVDQIFAVQKRVGSRERINIISAYRSKASNEELRQRRRGVAKRSYHTLGRAVDICIPDVNLPQQRVAALRMSAGGVGYYPRSSFIHLDSGPVRSW